MDILFYNRKQSEVQKEHVYGDKFIDWMYKSKSGKLLGGFLVKTPLSIAYGFLQSLGFSHNKVLPFIEDFKINMDDYKFQAGHNESKPYSSFNDFFIREFQDGKRPFVEDSNLMGAFSEARYFGYEKIEDTEVIPVKGKDLSAKDLLANSKWEETFQDGPLLLARLCPVDYHRYHYPDDGELIETYKVGGNLHSVNPLALENKSDIFTTNVREVSILETKHFGKLAYIEVGAICVGKIVQKHKEKEFIKGDQKGYFLFGGSTVIVLGEKGRWKPSHDIIENTKKAMETYIHLGDEVAKTL